MGSELIHRTVPAFIMDGKEARIENRGTKMRLRKKLTIWSALAVAASAAQARTLDVPWEYPAIQQAIEAARDGDVVLVMPGTYFETLNFLGKAILVTSAVPEDSNIVAATVVDASGVDCGELYLRWESGGRRRRGNLLLQNITCPDRLHHRPK